jgi:hypothetical protein
VKQSRPFYIYGEGSVTHSDDRPCDHGIGIHHPTIEREAWPSRWAYYRSLVAQKWHDAWIRRVARSGYFERQRAAGVTRDYERNLPMGRWDRLLRRIVGDPFPLVPRVWAPLRPEESIYPSAIESAEWWAQRRAATFSKKDGA